MKPPSPVYDHHLPVGVYKLRCHASGHSETHRREAIRDDDRVRLCRREAGCDPELVHSHVTDNDVFVGKRGSQLLHKARRMYGEGGSDGPQLLRIAKALPIPLGGCEVAAVCQRAEAFSDLTNDFGGGKVAAVQFGRGAVDVHDGTVALAVPDRRGPLNKVVADCEDEICFRQRTLRCLGRLKSHRRQCLGVSIIECSFAHERGHDGNIQSVDKLSQHRRGLPADDAIARQHEGTLRPAEEFDGPGDAFRARDRVCGASDRQRRSFDAA